MISYLLLNLMTLLTEIFTDKLFIECAQSVFSNCQIPAHSVLNRFFETSITTFIGVTFAELPFPYGVLKNGFMFFYDSVQGLGLCSFA